MEFRKKLGASVGAQMQEGGGNGPRDALDGQLTRRMEQPAVGVRRCLRERVVGPLQCSTRQTRLFHSAPEARSRSGGGGAPGSPCSATRRGGSTPPPHAVPPSWRRSPAPGGPAFRLRSLAASRQSGRPCSTARRPTALVGDVAHSGADSLTEVAGRCLGCAAVPPRLGRATPPR
jgi:hypothetical protein